ncbi:uncharacterized protein LOC114363347 [Ostrinia furnacalis]|uniref:uncharacterized protein LOC114363347 n=1 Tax=Ostrinia furnacalis TaxID=93504 RepID=UPI0010406BBA|nr:uncharacterized protein LOC114363347 [Ostrinia furnacalis]
MRRNCVVPGCWSSDVSKAIPSFFTVPNEDEVRRSTWLKLITREDLMNKRSQNHLICEEHFDPADIIKGKRRKNLKSNAVPCKKIPTQDLQKQATVSEPAVDQTTQTDAALAAKGPLKRKSGSKNKNCSKVKRR